MNPVNLSAGGVGQRSSYGFICIILICVLQSASVQSEYGTIAGKWKITNTIGLPQQVYVGSNRILDVPFYIYNVDLSSGVDFYFQVQIANNKFAFANKTIQRSEFPPSDIPNWYGLVQVEGRHFGYTDLYVTLHSTESDDVEHSDETVPVAVVRDERTDDKIFNYTTAALVLLMFFNLGTVLDLKRFKAILFRPIGPFIGFCSRYILMPALGLGMGYLFFPEKKELQLALFFTALAPSGGLANICVVFLKGNINLSIAATTINSLLALGMLPFWIFVLARVVYEDSTLSVPFWDLAVGSAALIVAITLGVILRLALPKLTKFIVKFLKPLSVVLSLCLVGLTVGIHAFIFKELSLMIFLAAFCLPIIGYVVSFVLSKILCRSSTDSMTIGIETSVLNMTVPIVMLQRSLEQPKADMTIVVPIIAALVSLGLVVIFYIVRRIFGWNVSADSDAFDQKQLLVDE